MPSRKHNQEPVRPIIVKKVIEQVHAGHHGGAWKVAYADFVTAMMAFFLLMWLIGATTEKQRKSIADYFAPTLIQSKKQTGGGFGMFGGDSLQKVDSYPTSANSVLMHAPMLAMDIGKDALDMNRDSFAALRKELKDKAENSSRLSRLMKNVRFTETREGLRIDMVDDADFSMFATGTSTMTPEATDLLQAVSAAIADTPNPLIIRGHTDAAPWTRGSTGNNWELSASRAEVTRRFLLRAGLSSRRIARIEGVADSEPYVPDAPYDPRNRRISVTLGWTDAVPPTR